MHSTVTININCRLLVVSH